MNNQAVIFNWSITEVGVMMEFAICTDVLQFARRAIKQGFSVYLGVIENQGKMYDYVIAFAGIEQLVDIQNVALIYFPSYVADLERDGLYPDLVPCLTDTRSGYLKREI